MSTRSYATFWDMIYGAGAFQVRLFPQPPSKVTLGILQCHLSSPYSCGTPFHLGDIVGGDAAASLGKLLKIFKIIKHNGGDEGIRTLETVPRLHP